ncbi:MAG: hypothetical protein HOP04_02140 [Methylophilaceae bacterium]|nr:hypothetical protein [Methylophilaceae bacterium]
MLNVIEGSIDQTCSEILRKIWSRDNFEEAKIMMKSLEKKAQLSLINSQDLSGQNTPAQET